MSSTCNASPAFNAAGRRGLIFLHDIFREHSWFDIRIIKIKMILPIFSYLKWVGSIFFLRHLECSIQFPGLRFRGFGRLTLDHKFSPESLEIECVSPVQRWTNSCNSSLLTVKFGKSVKNVVRCIQGRQSVLNKKIWRESIGEIAWNPFHEDKEIIFGGVVGRFTDIDPGGAAGLRRRNQ
ncbi:MAG TPA: hypothetical protein VH597_09305 [Verrucomicrobiae bacterium]|jgi:hypothetical protein|nr:hypothetical protein [Verrucomicrobiae bacterium]